jgi:ribonuclease E
MPKRMLIDATHAEETRVVVLDGNRLEDFDIETSAKRQLKGNIYLAKVVRVEPSLQAAFVEYGGNRHGFLAFSEIHPDYYQIPIADRQRLLELQAEQARLEEEEDDLEIALNQAGASADTETGSATPAAGEDDQPRYSDTGTLAATSGDDQPRYADTGSHTATESRTAPSASPDAEYWARSDQPSLFARTETESPAATVTAAAELVSEAVAAGVADGPAPSEPQAEPWAVAALPALITPERTIVATDAEYADEERAESGDDLDMFGSIPEEAPPETVGGEADSDSDNGDDQTERRIPPRFLRNYHIQEVIHRRQILLVQVVKEERGTKGAALTTYLSLAGRFSVLMPNSPRGGGISRKITSATDRRRLKEIMTELDIPKGMGLIVRTAGAQRPKPEIRRDCEYLLRLWDDIRDHTLKSIAPALIYEEASLIKRAIRDVYSRDVDDITVDGEVGWRSAHEFMRMLMPSHARKVQLWPDQGQSLFARFQVEAQLDAMLQPTVQLRSGGYLVINQAEALVAIDVNSGRSTRERNVEETALRTNLEAADEVARQLRLRDLAGLIVIDFIDMESKRHNAMVERRLKEALKDDRARIQVGHISHFGLLEMSRQRLRPSLEETTLILCPHCNGTGHVRGTESAALHVLRGVEEEAGKRRSAEVIVHVATPIALYILNHKRERLNEVERRYGMRVIIAADDSLLAPRFRIERLRTLAPGEEPRFVTPDAPRPTEVAPRVAEAEPVEAEDDDDTADADGDEADDAVAAAGAEDTEEGREAERRRRRRRRRRRGGREDEPRPQGAAEPGLPFETVTVVEPLEHVPEIAPEPVAVDDDAARRRSRRGRGRRRGGPDGDLSPLGVPGAEQPDLVPAYAGPTPADPFGGTPFDIFDAMEQAELNAAQQARPPAARRGAPGGRSRWQPPHWAVASEPPMLVPEGTSSSRPDRGPAPEPWALASRPFMMRRDRHTPRWAQQRVAASAPRTPDTAPAEPETRRGRPVRIEAGPPPVAETVVATVAEEFLAATVAPSSGDTPVERVETDAAAERPEMSSASDEAPPAAVAPLAADSDEASLRAVGPLPGDETPQPVAAAPPEADEVQPSLAIDVPPAEELASAAVPEPQVPANDVVAGPVVQPIVIGSESAPPVERKRGWWRRR